MKMTEYTAIRELIPDSSWVGAVYVVEATDKDYASLVWTTKEHPETAYFWHGRRWSVLEDFNDLLDVDSDGGSVGRELLNLGNSYNTKDKVENFSCRFDTGSGLLPNGVAEKLAEGGYLSNASAENTWGSFITTYTWPPSGTSLTPPVSVFKDPNDEVIWAIKVFLRSLPEHYRDAIRDSL
jgi:hypothetical protein